jgi:hypothetical protein
MTRRKFPPGVIARPNSLAAWAVVLFAGLGTAATPAAAQDAAKPGAVLNSTSSYWRVFYVVSPPVVRNGSALKKLSTLTEPTPPPPKEWTQVSFDDNLWSRVVGRPFPAKLEYADPKETADAGITGKEGDSPALAMICMRGKFGVTDPAAVGGLKLSIGYRGGVIVYVNGKEVGRASMAKDASGLDAVAEDYPKEAFVTGEGNFEIRVARGQAGAPPAFAARARTAEIAIPATALQKGANVLAVEIHRAAYMSGFDELVLSKKLTYQLYDVMWATCGLNSLTLQGASPAGLAANVSRPKGFQVWNSQPMQADLDLDYGDPFEPLGPINMVGTRNAVCSGKVVVGSDQAIKGLKARISDLAGKSGGTIPASAVQVRYTLPTGEEPILEEHYSALPDLLDGLSETAPDMVDVRTKKKGTWPFGAVCSVWVTVAVGDKAAPGEYTGKLTISADGQKALDVPVALKVCNWLAPNPSEFRTVLDIMQSPETVALQYNVPIYSDKHFKLLEKSLERAGYVGAWTLHIPLICRSNLGNEETMVRWIKQSGGGYKYDFTPLEKYLDLAQKHMGKPKAVDLVVWDLFLGFQGLEDAPSFITHNTNLPPGFKSTDIPVSLLDEATGKVTMGTVGRYDEAGKANWKALVEGLMDRLRKRGLDKSLHLGHSYDLCPYDSLVQFWSDLLPGVQYFRYGHYDYRTFGKLPAGKSDFIVHEVAFDWHNKPNYGWKNPAIAIPWLRLRSERGGDSYWKSDPYVTVPVEMFRLFGEICIQGPYRGFGRMGLDFWPVLENEKGRKNALAIQGRYPTSSWRQSDEMIQCIVPPGPDGALSSTKLEIMREGLQETEARIFLESTLLTRNGALSASLAAKAQAVLDGRVKALQMTLEPQPIAGFNSQLRPFLDGYSFNGLLAVRHSAIFQQWFMESGWQARTEELFNVAGEVAAATGAR